MEFLMTYGWAILVVLAAIGALAYFGVLSPDRFLPDKCTANPPFACTEYQVNGTGLMVEIQNSAGVSVSIQNVSMSCNGGTNAVANVSTTGSGSVLNGNAIQFGWGETQLDAAAEADCGTWNTGDRFKATYDIRYIREGESTVHVGSGSIQVRAE